MRRAIICLSAVSMLAAGAAAQTRPHRPAASAHPAAPARAAAPARPAGPPHAWLFGTWTGGLFPVLDGMVEQDCRVQPTVSFDRDHVVHAMLTNSATAERIIETVRTTPEGAEFRLTPSADDPAGFGCDDPNVLYVMRQSDNTISFPRCAAFPYPLQRCSGHG